MQVYLTSLLGLNQTAVFAATLIQCRGGSRNLTSFKMELLAAIAND